MGGVLLLGEVHQTGEGEHRHTDQHEEQAELTSRFADGEEEALQAGKVSYQLEDPQNLRHPDQTHHLAGLADDVELREVVDDDVDKVGEDGEQVHEIEGLDEEVKLSGAAAEADEVLDGEVDGREIVHVQDDESRRAALFAVFAVDHVEVGVRAARGCRGKRSGT